MASGKSDTIDTEEEDHDSEDERATSEYLSVTEGMTSTIRSGMASFSDTYLSVRGVEEDDMTIPFRPSEYENSSDDLSNMVKEIQLKDRHVELSEAKEIKLCSNCKIDGHQTAASHFCESCGPSGRFICHTCLRSHNRWSVDHVVLSLSLVEASLARPENKIDTDVENLVQEEHMMRDPTNVKCNIQEMTDSETQAIDITKEISNPIYDLDIDIETKTKKELSVNQKTKSKFAKQEPDRSGTLHHPKMKMLRPNYFKIEQDFKNAKPDRTPFYKDKLFCELTKETRYKAPSQVPLENLTKYGTYLVRENSDVKTCIITGACQMEDNRIVLSDSENCKLKILDPNTFGISSSHVLENNPSVICYVKGQKVAVATVNFEVMMTEIAKDFEIQDTFKVNFTVKSLAYSDGHLYVCSSNVIALYSESGEKKLLFQPTCSEFMVNCINSICINRNGDTIYVADKDVGIVALDKQGNILKKISDNVNEPNGMCLEGSGKLLATELSSRKVFEIDQQNGVVKLVIREICQKDVPTSLCYEKEGNRLIVCVWNSDHIHVFSCL